MSIDIHQQFFPLIGLERFRSGYLVQPFQGRLCITTLQVGSGDIDHRERRQLLMVSEPGFLKEFPILKLTGQRLYPQEMIAPGILILLKVRKLVQLPDHFAHNRLGQIFRRAFDQDMPDPIIVVAIQL